MPDSSSSRFAGNDEQWLNPLEIDLSADRDLVMEQILENINNTPLGQVLKSIASMPEIRREKVLRLRQQITEGRYDLAGRLDVVLDKVLEDLTSQR
ncbi:MAG: flagellar biosynthesis anti-sigma factor FlgM [Sedimentisphaerales bacterium]|nr:flagellar biosynthesis anti-sigma factor FlgM [Sedimentisphaerales bacterium]